MRDIICELNSQFKVKNQKNTHGVKFALEMAAVVMLQAKKLLVIEREAKHTRPIQTLLAPIHSQIYQYYRKNYWI